MSENCGVFVDEVYSWTLNHERTRLPRFRNQVQLLPLQAMRQRPQAKQRGIWVEPGCASVGSVQTCGRLLAAGT